MRVAPAPFHIAIVHRTPVPLLASSLAGYSDVASTAWHHSTQTTQAEFARGSWTQTDFQLPRNYIQI